METSELEKNFFIGINCFHGNNKYKFKRLLASLLVKPSYNQKWYPETTLSLRTTETPLMVYNRNEADYIRSNLLGIPDKSLSDMVKFLLNRRFELCEKNICVEFLIDGVDINTDGSKELFKIIEEFKTFHPNVIISGTKQHTSLTVNRNIFLKNHKTEYVCFCDDDDLSCSIDSKFELFEIYIHYIFEQFHKVGPVISKEYIKYKNSEKVLKYITDFQNIERKNIETLEIMKITNEFRKTLFDFLLTNPDYTDEYKQTVPKQPMKENIQVEPTDEFHGSAITEPIVLTDYLTLKPYSYASQAAKFIYYTSSFFGPHFFPTYTTRHNSCNISYGIWSLIIPPWTIDNYTNVKEVKNEDVIYDVMHHLIRPKVALAIKITKPIYFYLSPSYNDYENLVTNDSIASLGNSMMYGPNKKYKLSKEGFEYDSIVEYSRKNVPSFEFVSGRDFRGYSIEDVKKYMESLNSDDWVNDWNKFIKTVDL